MYVNNEDIHCWTKERKVLTDKQTHIPALRSFGYYCTNKATESISHHIHKNQLELHYIVQGNQKFYIKNKEFFLTGNDMFVTSPNVPHGSGTRLMTMREVYWMHIDMTQTENFLGLNSINGSFLKKELASLQNTVYTGTSVATKYIKNAFNYLSNTDRGLQISGYGNLLCFFHEAVTFEFKDGKRIEKNIKATMNYITENIYNNISLDTLSQTSGLSVSRFKYKFKQQVGISPRGYINTLKIEESKKLLEKGYSITDVAFNLGFNTSTYFATVFKQYTTISPSDFQKNSFKEE